MIKLFVLMIVLVVVALVLYAGFVIISGELDNRAQLRKEKKRSVRANKEVMNSEDAAWLYANGASLSQIQAAEEQRRLLK